MPVEHPPADARREAMRAGLLLGWLSVAAVLVELALGMPVRHETAVVALALAAAIGNGAMPFVPWGRLLPERYSGAGTLLDLWAGALLVFVGALVVLAGAEARFDLLLFLVLPFIAVTHEGRRLAAWLAATAIVFAAAMALAPAPLDAGEIALHAVLLIASATLALALARATRRTAEAAARAAAAAELEQALLAESHHRIKNSLQTVADLLLLGRPEDASGGEAFDATAARIRSIAAVHHLLAGERGGTVAADELLRTVVAASASPREEVVVVSDELRLHSAQAQQLGVIANELVANALRHGGPPIAVVLASAGGGEVVLEVRDGGRAGAVSAGADAASRGGSAAGGNGAGAGGADGRRAPSATAAPTGLGLTLVRQIAEAGLGGSFALDARDDGSTIAVLRFNVADHAHPDR
ncbi:histidine kinase dimerization/phosphoacceptor domain -containing protein [Conexibacter arvalis]|nr:sensor histidine kinase [Conexibacter arvalis]